MRKIDKIEVGTIVTCLLFAIAISLYHVSFDGYLGLSQKFWNTYWAVCENGFMLFLTGIIAVNTIGIVKRVFKYVLAPYFVLKLIYHISCYAGIYLFSERLWRDVWSYILVLLIIVMLIYCLTLILKKDVA